MYAVVVTFTIKPDANEAFMPLMHNNAQISLSQEPDCHQFDVLTDPDQPNEVLLYELYTDAAAFDVHLASDHFKRFNAETADMVAAKTVRTFTQVAQ